MQRNYEPADFGDLGLRHEVHVFAFRRGPAGIQYLLVQPRPREEGVWRPVANPVLLEEDLRAAALRAVRAEIGYPAIAALLSSPAAPPADIGDLRLIGWPFALLLRRPTELTHLSPKLAALRWEGFENALRLLAAPRHRQNLLQVHWRLSAA